ncbi:MAG: NADH-quinone oxidoreductase subunit C [Nitrososphaerota archaeon]|nr:NADH-quinone oxidoreductase subunit C [Candidatus Nezhaarchaeota archaeon]MDW8050711.1 NADH-quinone oxidoreductase subunit C [Nitrososphaerota archaeon]
MAERHLEVLNVLRNELKEALLNVEYLAGRRILVIKVDKASIIRAIDALNKISGGEAHLTTISGADLGTADVELTYFMWLIPQRLRVIIKTVLPKSELKIQSVVNVAPAAILYEREVYEMLGVVFNGHPKLERLFLPEDWPEGVYPLRRD